MKAVALGAFILSVFGLTVPAMARFEFCLLTQNGDIHMCYSTLPSCQQNQQFFPNSVCMAVQR